MSRGLAWGMWGESGHCAIDGQTGLGSMLGGRRVCMSSTYVPSLECRRRPLRRRRRRRRCGAAEIAGPAARLQAPLACLCLALFACNYICSACKGHAGLRRTGGEEFTQGFGIHAPTCSSARILPQHPGCGAGAWTASVGWQDGLRRRLTQCACWAAGAGIRRWAVFLTDATCACKKRTWRRVTRHLRSDTCFPQSLWFAYFWRLRAAWAGRRAKPA